jgi:hypothetical protein
VAGAVAIVFAISWPAMLKSLEARRWSAALVSFVALMLSGSYSVTAALGSATGGRINAATVEIAASDQRTKAQATYTTAKGELDALKPARSIGELEALLAVSKPPCRIVVQNGIRTTVCGPPAALVAELARAKRRQELAAKMDMASGELRQTQPAKVANSDAKALARYLTAVGLDIDADRLNDLLALLAVLMIEAGGGLSLAVGLALSGQVRSPRAAPATGLTGDAGQCRSPGTATVRPDPDALAEPRSALPAPTPAIWPIRSHPAGEVRPMEAEILTKLTMAGGASEGLRRLAASLGRPRSTVADECHRLAAAGRLVLGRGRRGMTIRLPEPVRLNWCTARSRWPMETSPT